MEILDLLASLEDGFSAQAFSHYATNGPDIDYLNDEISTSSIEKGAYWRWTVE